MKIDLILVKDVEGFLTEFNKNKRNVLRIRFETHEDGFTEEEYFEALEIECEKRDIKDLLLFLKIFFPSSEAVTQLPHGVYKQLETIIDSPIYNLLKAQFLALGFECEPDVLEAARLINTYDEMIQEIAYSTIFSALSSEEYAPNKELIQEWIDYGIGVGLEEAYNLRATQALQNGDMDKYIDHAKESYERGYLHGAFMLGFYYGLGGPNHEPDVELGLRYLNETIAIAEKEENEELANFVRTIIKELENTLDIPQA